jgi:hypothetical protein
MTRTSYIHRNDDDDDDDDDDDVYPIQVTVSVV